MQQSDMSSRYYQYYQSHLQNPNPPSNPIDPPQLNPLPTTYASASAPPVSSSYSSSDYSNYSSPYPPYSRNSGYVPDPPLTHPPNPDFQSANTSHQPYSYPGQGGVPQQEPYYPYDQNQANLNYDNSHLNYDYSSNSYSSAPYSTSTAPNYGNLNGNSLNYAPQYDQGGSFSDDVDAGVYKYSGGKEEPYGARGSRTEPSSGLLFDDYGRPISFPNRKEQNGSGHGASSSKIVKAIPKMDMQQDIKSGVQKFRVKLLSESAGQIDMDVLCQIGLDGIRVLDPATSRTLKIYSLENVTRWEVLDSYIFAFWAKTSVDIEPRRIRLKSNSYTTTNILDTVTAASIQVKEIGGSNKSSDTLGVSEQPSDKKKGFVDWMNLMKPANLEKDHWVPDDAVTKCKSCGTDFGAFVRRHHCRNCGDIFCDKCTQGRIALTADEDAQVVRVCDRCMAECTQRLSNASDGAAKVSGLQSHEDLAKRLQEVMDKNRKTSTGMNSVESGIRMREVECPTCTVHLQVEVPSSGSETIECSVCQHPFLATAH